MSESRRLLRTWLDALQARDRGTLDHAHEVATLSADLARRLGLTAKETSDALWGGRYHDLGKLLVPVRILTKPLPLNDEERAVMQLHPAHGAELVAPLIGMREVAVAIRHHHERWDGEGYPDGLVGEAIPPLARILAVCDSYSAMRQPRCYQGPKSRRDTLETIAFGAGKQWCPRAVSHFLDLMQ